MATMKKYIATFWRGNPQMKNGGYETTREIEAVSITSARKKARDIEDGCAYGSMSLLSMQNLSGRHILLNTFGIEQEKIGAGKLLEGSRPALFFLDFARAF